MNLAPDFNALDYWQRARALLLLGFLRIVARIICLYSNMPSCYNLTLGYGSCLALVSPWFLDALSDCCCLALDIPCNMDMILGQRILLGQQPGFLICTAAGQFMPVS